ncbi:MAG: prepilin-type N-terminal cleavage/methylation domain-containing protein [Pseudomonadales bacterium]|nr:prepilin-type N-terminal cleavage/methylation domain-containing protein [Pseudomonadales bacterium]
MNFPKNKGITFIELLVSLSVLAITASFAVSSFSSYIKDRRIDETSDHIRDSLKLARSNAVMGDGGRLIPDATNGWGQWEVQDQGNNIVYRSQPASRTKVAVNRGTVDANGELSWANIPILNPEEIQFSALGALRIKSAAVVSPLAGVVFDVCSEGDDRPGKQIFVSQLGWINTKTCDCTSEVCN